MSEPKWTPGPWVWSNIMSEVAASDPEACELVAYGERDAKGCQSIDTVASLLDEFAIKPADAQLIAAAPDLYAALAQIVDAEPGGEDWAAARAALAKAGGEA